MNRPVLVGVALLALAACSTPSAAPTPTPTPSVATSAVAKTYTSITDLRDDAVKAGYPCTNWAQTNRVKLAAASGTCDDTSVFMLFLSPADVSTNVQMFKAMDGPVNLLVGPNWILNVHTPTKYQKGMGGIVVERS